MQRIIDEQVDALLEQGCIEPSRSPHSAPLVLVRKKTGQWRMCVDYRQLNAKSIPDAYPLPRINHILERLRNAKYISTLDLRNGYWQIPMACSFFKRKIAYLGHVISDQGIHTDPDKVAAVRNLSPPTSLRELRRCLGMASISQKYYWPWMFRDVRRYVRQCVPCQKFKLEQRQQAVKMLTRQVNEPFGILCAEFVGPLPRSKEGNTVLLVFFDLFTK
ncbi:hypothetical protein KR059_009170, partial [Drosophila kikkawai]